MGGSRNGAQIADSGLSDYEGHKFSWLSHQQAGLSHDPWFHGFADSFERVLLTFCVLGCLCAGFQADLLDHSFVNTVGEIIGSRQWRCKRAAPRYHCHMHHYSHTQRASNGAGSSAELIGSPPLSGQSPTGEPGVPGFQKKRVCFDAMNLTQAMTELPSKRLRQNRHFTLQARYIHTSGYPRNGWLFCQAGLSTMYFLVVTLLAQGEQRNFGPPDPLDADPLDLMASQAHLLDTTHASRLERGNSSKYPQQLEPLPPPSIQEIDVCC